MAFEQKVTFLAQNHSGECFRQGVVQSEDAILGIDAEQGLMVLAKGQSEFADDALTAVKIMIDDMRTNLDVTRQSAQKGQVSRAGMCMSESLTNINEFLLDPTRQEAIDIDQPAVSIIAVQVVPGQVSVICSGSYQCLLMRQGQLTNLINENMDSPPVGQTPKVSVVPLDHTLSVGDTILLIRRQDGIELGMEFMRLTLSRFADNMEMALRQINTRCSRQGMKRKPVLALAWVSETPASKRSWLDRLRKS